MTVKIYGFTPAVCPQRVMLCLIEKGIAFEIIPVDLQKLEQKQPNYLSKQPFGQVPYVVDGDFELYESRAIVRYYAAKYADKGPDLFGRTLEEKALVDQWLDIEAINFNPLVFSIVFNLHVLPQSGATGNAAEVEAAVEKLGAVLDIYDRQLSKTKYLAGDRFTLADLTHIPATMYVVGKCGLSQLIDDREHVEAWWKDITNRPAVKRVISMVDSNALSFSP
ncbi:hypothetical protein J5N97_023707 [Dioscorea zingiberensis]|uniref:glutathione transferase n=1 Tax=Dioscorea zingiberensis TaxID=325984 RepID=A0A9D5C5R8_9LILI|nr:hypothetical protein J5N97_023707 [Dioscorea zingiberensis]